MDAPQATDALLVQAAIAEPAALPAFLQALQAVKSPAAVVRVQAAYSPSLQQLYAYLHLGRRESLTQHAVQGLQSSLQKEFSNAGDVRVSRLEQVFSTAGASISEKPVFHYVVEMDPEAGWMPELSQWYDTEHMPGLATVPGCIRASRYLNHDHGPLSLACYDLVTKETLGSPPWLAVRGTPWSDRMRPKFTNTKRTMFDAWAAAD